MDLALNAIIVIYSQRYWEPDIVDSADIVILNYNRYHVISIRTTPARCTTVSTSTKQAKSCIDKAQTTSDKLQAKHTKVM